jgi:hypothetical protein
MKADVGLSVFPSFLSGTQRLAFSSLFGNDPQNLPDVIALGANSPAMVRSSKGLYSVFLLSKDKSVKVVGLISDGWPGIGSPGQPGIPGFTDFAPKMGVL